MKRGIFSEYLGDVSTELFLQNLTNTNSTAEVNIDAIREMFPHGFSVTGEFETTVYETETEAQECLEILRRRLSKATSPREQMEACIPADKLLVRLILEPKR